MGVATVKKGAELGGVAKAVKPKKSKTVKPKKVDLSGLQRYSPTARGMMKDSMGELVYFVDVVAATGGE